MAAVNRSLIVAYKVHVVIGSTKKSAIDDKKRPLCISSDLSDSKGGGETNFIA